MVRLAYPRTDYPRNIWNIRNNTVMCYTVVVDLSIFALRNMTKRR